MSTIIIEEINNLIQQCENIMPSIEEITNFEGTLTELNYLTFGMGCIDIITENAKSFEGANPSNNILQFERRKAQMAIHESKIRDLKNQLSILETQYEKKSREQDILQDKMKELTTERDVILAFKLGTLSQLSYNKKLQFGFLLNKNTLDYKTFGIGEDSPEQVENRWTILKSFIDSIENRAEDE